MKQPRFNSYRWFICGILFLATTINYIDRQILALLKPMLDGQLHWTNRQFGMVNAVFQGAYAVGLLFFGWCVDRFGTKLGYGISIVAWSVAAIGHSLASTVGSFSLARIALGLGEGGSFPSAIKAVALWFPKRERAYATSIFNSGANVGAVIAPATVPWIAAAWGWQACFVIAGISGLAWLGLWIPFYDVPEKQTRLHNTEREIIQSDPDEIYLNDTDKKTSWAKLLSHRRAWSFIVAKLITDPIWWFFLIWLPDYFNATRGLDLKHSWMHLVAIYLMVTVLSIIGGWVPGRLIQRGWTVSRARKTCMFACSLTAIPILFATHVDNWSAVFLIGLAASAHQAWSANLYSTVGDMFPKKEVASLVGIGGMAGSAGAIFFPIFTGAMLDHFKYIGNIKAGYGILFTICGFAYLVAFGLSHLLAPTFSPVES